MSKISDFLIYYFRGKKNKIEEMQMSRTCYYGGGSKSPCNHLFSLHMGAFIQRWQVYIKYEPLSFMPCNMDSVASLVALRH